MVHQKKLKEHDHSTTSEEDILEAESISSSHHDSDHDASPVSASDTGSEAAIEEREASSSEEDESDHSDQTKRRSFEDLGLNKWLIETLQNVSITRPSEIQEACIPAILDGLISSMSDLWFC
jgi:ATP-dependent RNA helicase DDX49/DBP8